MLNINKQWILNVPLNIFLFNNWKNRMLRDFYIPRVSNDTKIAVQTNNLGAQILYRSPDAVKKSNSPLKLQTILRKNDFPMRPKFWYPHWNGEKYHYIFSMPIIFYFAFFFISLLAFFYKSNIEMKVFSLTSASLEECEIINHYLHNII